MSLFTSATQMKVRQTYPICILDVDPATQWDLLEPVTINLFRDRTSARHAATG
jgi:hypothetical protein